MVVEAEVAISVQSDTKKLDAAWWVDGYPSREWRLRRVMSTAARLVCDLSSRDHVTSAPLSLHWLPIKQIFAITLCLLVHLSINGKTSIYLEEIITRARLGRYLNTRKKKKAHTSCYTDRYFHIPA